MNQEQAALMLVEESVKRWGFVVCKYRSDVLPSIGSITKVLWQVYAIPQPFVVLRLATDEEWRLQLELSRLFVDPKDIRNRKEPGIQGTAFVLVTD